MLQLKGEEEKLKVMPRHSAEPRRKDLACALCKQSSQMLKQKYKHSLLFCGACFFMILNTTHAHCGKHENMEYYKKVYHSHYVRET